MEQTVDFSVIKEKIIKTSELLQLYEDKSTKLSRANRAYKELKTKFDTHKEETTRIKLDNERLTFSLNSLKTKDEELQNLKEQHSKLEDKYNQTLIESQLRFSDLEEKLNSYKSIKKEINVETVRNSRKNGEKINEFQEKITELKKVEQSLMKEIAQLVLKNKEVVKDLDNEKKSSSQIKAQLNEKNIQLTNEIKNLKEKLKYYQRSSQDCTHLQKKLSKLENEKNMEISDLLNKLGWCEKQISLAKTRPVQESVGIQVCLELENIHLKNELKSVQLIENGCEKNMEISQLVEKLGRYEKQISLAKTRPIQESVGIQVCLEFENIHLKNEFKPVQFIENGCDFNIISKYNNHDLKIGVNNSFEDNKKTMDDLLNEEIMLSVDDILKEMILPRALSPVSISSSNIDEQSLNLLNDLEGCPLLLTEIIDNNTEFPKTNTSNNIPEIIITPPTPNVEKLSGENFPHFDEKPDITNSNQAAENEKTLSHIEPKIFKEASVQTHFLRKKFRMICPKIPDHQLKLRRTMQNKNVNTPIFKRRNITSQQYKYDPILKALQVLKENKINFTISSDSIPLLPTDYYNFPTTYPQSNSTMIVPKYPNTKTERFTKCWCKKCSQSNSLMLLDNTCNENLLGFFNVKREVVTPACSMLAGNTTTDPSDKIGTKDLLNQLLDGIKELVATKHTIDKKTPTKKKKKKLSRNSEFNSETETEIERLFKKTNVLQRNKMLLQAAKDQQVFNSECDTLIESDSNLQPPEINLPSCSSISSTTNEAFSSSLSAKIQEFTPPERPNTVISDLSKFSTYPDLISPLASSAKGESPSKRYSERLRKIKTSLVSSDNASPRDHTSDISRNTRTSRKIDLEFHKNAISEDTGKTATKECSLPIVWTLDTKSKATTVKKRGRPPKCKPVSKSKEFVTESESETNLNLISNKISTTKSGKQGIEKFTSSGENCKGFPEICSTGLSGNAMDTKGETIPKSRSLKSKPVSKEYITDSQCDTIITTKSNKIKGSSTVSDEHSKLSENSCDLAEQLYLSDSETEIQENNLNKKIAAKPAQKPKKKPQSTLKLKVLQQTRAIRDIYNQKNINNRMLSLVTNKEISKESDNESAKESVKSVDSGFYETSSKRRDFKNIISEQANHKNKKITVVHDILIKKCGDTVDLVKIEKQDTDSSVQNNKSNSMVMHAQCSPDRKRRLPDQYIKVEQETSNSNRNSFSKKRRLEEKIKPSMETDILGQVMHDMMKNRPPSKADVKKKRLTSSLNQNQSLNGGPTPVKPPIGNVIKENFKRILENAKIVSKIESNNGTNTEQSLSKKLNNQDSVANCSKNEDEIPDYPQSPEPEDVPESLPPKIIPFKRPNKLPPSRVQVLINKLINFPNQDEVLEEVVESFAGQDLEYITKIIFDRVSCDVKDKATNKYHPSPVLTDIQRTLLGFMARLQRGSYPEIYETFLAHAEFTLLNTVSCKLEMIQPVTRMYTAICKLKRDINRMRRFVCEAFYFMGDFAVPLFFFVLTIWAEVLPMEAESKAFPMAKVLVQIVFLKGCNKPGYNLLPLRDLLHKYFGYPSERWNCDAVFEDILIEYLRNPALRSSDFMLLLFCKNKPTKWVYQKLKTHLMPLLDKIPLENHNLRAMIIILVGNICHCFNKFEEYDWTVIQEMSAWFDGLETDNTPTVVKRSIDLAVSRLPRKTKIQRKREKAEEVKSVVRKSICEENIVTPCIKDERVLETKAHESITTELGDATPAEVT